VRFSLIFRVGAVLGALPVDAVVETMRPLPLTPLSGAPDVVMGAAMVHGAPVPVLAVWRLLQTPETPPGRLVIVRLGARRAGLAVDAVIGLRDLPAGLPPLLRHAGPERAGLAAFDAELSTLLDAAGSVDPEIFATPDQRVAGA
jgi:purine-binding chemotaxis protein CheW